MKNLYKIKDELYIISDKEKSSYCIKECPMAGLNIDRCDCQIFTACSNKVGNIILTTNKLLIEDGVQSIDDEFLEWFVKNPTCEFIKITKTSKLMNDFLYGLSFYKIIIPKEEQDNKMYSEEEVLEILKKFNQNAMEYIKQDDRNIMTSVTLEKWFEQFKKK